MPYKVSKAKSDTRRRSWTSDSAETVEYQEVKDGGDERHPYLDQQPCSITQHKVR
jgi:hypothetical protein